MRSRAAAARCHPVSLGTLQNGRPEVFARIAEACAPLNVQLVISHAGLITTLTALDCGVPVLAIPITNEQPGIAARLASCGAGRAAGGVGRAADLIEQLSLAPPEQARRFASH